MNHRFQCLMLALWLAAMSGEAAAQAFHHIRIGDADGFGFAVTENLKRPLRGNGPGPADTNKNGVLEPTEFLPDLDGDGRVWFYGGDQFDHRWDVERTNRSIECIGCLSVSAMSQGSAWTDLSLSPASAAKDWPDLNGSALPNIPTFLFDFTVAAGAIVEGTSVFFNLIAADFDYDRAFIQVRFANGKRQTLTLRTPIGPNFDGLIQESTANFDFENVFTADNQGDWRGFVMVTVETIFEPYNAIDYAELSVFAAVAARPVPDRFYASR